MPENKDAEVRYPDSVRIASGRLVRINQMNPEKSIVLAGAGNHRLKVRDIQERMNGVVLACGRPYRGILLKKGDLVFCEAHEKLERVVQVVA